jgi:DNA primase
MARLPEEQIARLKQDVSLLRLVQSQGYQPVRHGKDWLMRCPFHDDKTPSLVISEHNNLWHCLGACGVGGSVIDWVMKTQGVSFRFACELLQNDAGLVTAAAPVAGALPPGAPAYRPSVGIKKNTTTKLASPLAADANDQALLAQVVDYYHETLLQSPEALAYLDKRGLNDPALISAFKLGYANRTLGYRLPEKNRKAGAELRGRLQALGVLRESGHEHLNGSLVVPLFDGAGSVAQLYGRKILDNLRPGTAYHLYLPGEHAGVWNVEALHACKEIILCESLIDAMTFWAHGFKNVTTSYGVNGFTADHLAAFKQHGTQRVLIAYDRDAAGDAAAEALTKMLTAAGIECFRILFPKGMDANEYALKMSPPQKALGLVIRKAEWLGSGAAPARETENTKTAAKEKISADIIPPLAATPMPEPAPPVLTADVSDDGVAVVLGERHYRVRGLDKNRSYEQLKVLVRVSRGEALYVDTVDFYAARSRAGFITQAALELGVRDDVIKTDLAALLLQLEAVQDQQIKNALEIKPAAVTISDAERAAALDLLRDPSLLSRLLTDFAVAGVVGEETNKLVAYLACVSRLLEKPLAVMIQSSSAAGKSSLMDAVLAFMPEEARVQYSAMTGQSLFYMGTTSLKNKILAISEEEGAHNASYALKLLQSEGEVTIASTGKDEATGNLVTRDYTVEGPVMLLMTTTAIDIDEELMNRCLVLSVNESREQTAAIHRAQRQKRTLAGLQTKLEKDRVLQLHRTAQRLLRPLAIINPYADQLTFLDDKTRTRRDHEKYLTLIDSIALLHQHQRVIQTVEHNGQRIDYIEVTLADIEHANQLAHEVLGKTLDELPPQTRKLLKLIQQLVREACATQGIEQRHYRFSRKEIRDYSGWGNTQLKLHCHRLEDMEYLLVHRGGRGQSFDYELLYSADIDAEAPHLMGLIDVEKLQKLQCDEKKSGLNAPQSVSGRAVVGGVSVPSRHDEIRENTDKNSVECDMPAGDAENAYLTTPQESSYRNNSYQPAVRA